MSPWEYARRYAEKSERLVVGLMSGTSVDGVDAVLVRIRGTGRSTAIEQIVFHEHPYPIGLREEVLRLSHGEGNAEDVSQANIAVGRLLRKAVEALLHRTPAHHRAIDLIASHGQTISHTPPQGSIGNLAREKAGATLQIGEPTILAQQLGIPVVSDFRTADMANGGQGAPLVPYADWCLLTHPMRTRAIQNIGGIANVTFLPANSASTQVIGFDTGPGNMLIDRAAQEETHGAATFDKEGEMAKQGTIHQPTLERLLNHPFLLREPPKSAGREQFGETFFQHLIRASVEENAWNVPVSRYDMITTLTAFTAQSIAAAYRRFLPCRPDEVIVGGGGAKNRTLMRMLQEQLAPARVLTHEDVGINSNAKEAIAFALLGNETMLGNPSNLPSVTGAERSCTLGKITFP